MQYIDPSEFMCLAPNQSMNVSGSFQEKVFEYTQLIFKGCSLEDQTQCRDTSEIDGTYLNFYHNDFIVDLKEDEPNILTSIFNTQTVYILD